MAGIINKYVPMRLEFWLIIGLLAACDSGEKPAVARMSRESAAGFRLLRQDRPGEGKRWPFCSGLPRKIRRAWKSTTIWAWRIRA